MKQELLKYIGELCDKAEAFDGATGGAVNAVNTAGRMPRTAPEAPRDLISMAADVQEIGYSLHKAMDRLEVKLGPITPPQPALGVGETNGIAGDGPSSGMMAGLLRDIHTTLAALHARIDVLTDRVQLP